MAPGQQPVIGSRFTAEPDFAASYDLTEPGLAAWIQEAINANALARGVDPATTVWPDDGV